MFIAYRKKTESFPFYCYPMRSGYTMVELIFVIIVIGVLASFALPRLAATRDDARMAVLAQEVMTGATDIAQYAISRGQTEQNLSRMSRAIAHLENVYGATQVSGEPTLLIPWKDTPVCLKLKIENQGQNTEMIVVDVNSTPAGESCKRLRSIIDVSRFPMPLRGQQVVF